MGPFDRTAPTGYSVVDDWADGVGWQVHPSEPGVRTSHAIRTASGACWLVDPLFAPGIETVYGHLGEVAGVAVLSDYHARDAAVFARRHGVPVTVPAALDRVASRLDAPTLRVRDTVAGFELHPVRPLGLWTETVAYRECDGTLYVPDVCSTGEFFRLRDERLGLMTVARLAPPSVLATCSPDRILCGHGPALCNGAAEALADTVFNARRRLPRALRRTAPRELRGMLAAGL